MSTNMIQLRSLRDPRLEAPVGASGLRIGRSSTNNLVLQNSQVSRQHAMIQYENGMPVLVDQNSALGTFVNNQRVQRVVLRPGDLVAFGPEQWQVEAFSGPAAAAAGMSAPANAPAAGQTSRRGNRTALFAIGGGVLVIVLLIAAVLLFARQGNSTTADGSAALVGYQNIQPAVIQIIGEGTFAEPEGMAYNAFGAGSGFIIDPSGVAVTNNHVVTGAAILKVKVGGDQSRTYNAKVLGVSECSDLAVIKIDGGPFPYLAWSQNSPKTGLDVYAAGFPLGEPEFSLTRGIVSKDQLEDLNTSWASIPHAIMHDATINPGNSGGPLVNDEGQVVGVNYAGSNENNQYFAIASDQAKDMVGKLTMGRDLETLGINGEAGIISFEDENKDKVYVPGLWISSIKSGSPADLIGIKPKDIIRRLENIYLIPIESNDTLNEIQSKLSMDKYCSILRSRNLTDQMEIEVVRIENGKLVTLEGKINGSPLVRKK